MSADSCCGDKALSLLWEQGTVVHIDSTPLRGVRVGKFCGEVGVANAGSKCSCGGEESSGIHGCTTCRWRRVTIAVKV
jgi:hypothetical protein